MILLSGYFWFLKCRTQIPENQWVTCASLVTWHAMTTSGNSQTTVASSGHVFISSPRNWKDHLLSSVEWSHFTCLGLYDCRDFVIISFVWHEWQPSWLPVKVLLNSNWFFKKYFIPSVLESLIIKNWPGLKIYIYLWWWWRYTTKPMYFPH